MKRKLLVIAASRRSAARSVGQGTPASRVDTWIPLPSGWPYCVKCDKPVDRLIDIQWEKERLRFTCRVECHGASELVAFDAKELRRVHFTKGRVLFQDRPAGVTTRRRIEL